MADAVQAAINDSRRVPNMVLSAHVHNYQLIERDILTPPGGTSAASTPDKAGKKHRTSAHAVTVPSSSVTPFLVCGHGGYYHLHGMNGVAGVTDPATGAHLVFEEHLHHGYMTLTVDAQTISGAMTLVADPGATTPPGPSNTFSYPAGLINLPAGVMVSL